MEPFGRISNRSTIPSLITCVCSGLLIVGLLLLCACGQQASNALTDATTANTATAPTPELPFQQQVHNILDTKDVKQIAQFRRDNPLRLEKAALLGIFDQTAASLAREQALGALDAMEFIAQNEMGLIAQNDSDDRALACNAWKAWQDARTCHIFGSGASPLAREPLTEEEEARLTHAFDVVFAHSLAAQARRIDTRLQRASLADLSGELGALRFPRMRGGFNDRLPRPNGISAVKELYDEGLIQRSDLLQLLRIGVRDESRYAPFGEEADWMDDDPNDRSLLALLQLEIPHRAESPTVWQLRTEGRIYDGAIGFKALADAFDLSDAELVALGVTAEEAHLLLQNERIADGCDAKLS
jgi:hypothetical protein